MSDTATPCQSSPEDWFIEKDGKQYPDDELVTNDELAEAVDALGGHVDDPGSLLLDLENKAFRAALTRRRRAKDACHVECPVRTQCLGIALATRPSSGTWGGYYLEEIRQILRLRDEREQQRLARRSQDADVGPDE